MGRQLLVLDTSSGLLGRHFRSASAGANLSEQASEKTPHRFFREKFINLLLSCSSARELHRIHAQVISHGFQHNDFTSPKIISALCQLKEVLYARKVFNEIPDRKVSLWNAMFNGYCQNGIYTEVVDLFREMKRMDVRPDCFTFPTVLKSCGKTSALAEGEQVHEILIKAGFRVDPFIGTALIDMYSGWGEIQCAFKVFRDMLDRNVVAWTSMVKAYLSCRDIDSARHLFHLAPERDIVLWNTMMSGYIETGDMVEARRIFDRIPNRDVMSWNTMLNGYANNGDVDACEIFFEEMPERNIFSWNGFISGYVRNGCLLQALNTFKRMLIEGKVTPNDATIMMVLSACARLGALDLGMWIHVYAENNGYGGNIYVGNALIDMYAKCGVVESAVNIFQSMGRKDLISWNTIINALAIHGRASEALKLFHEMKHCGTKPDGITFIGVLCACTHMGLVPEGFSHFHSMTNDFSITPQIEHYGCMVDLLGRAGLLAEAVDFVSKMPVKSDAVIWATLLGASKIYKNLEVAELSLERLIELEPNNPANYVMLSNIYGDLGRWRDVARLKLAMKQTGFKKLPGCSIIEIGADIVEFYSLDERHLKREEIHGVLKGMVKLLQSSGYVPDLTELEMEFIDGNLRN